ncbi:hypothetical protein V8F06_010852 [Rhypophila decipiens]
MAATATITETESSRTSPQELQTRPRRSSSKSVSKHLNLWRDIDDPPVSLPPTTGSSDTNLLTSILWKYLPTPVQQRLERISPQTYDVLTATFFSALAIVVLSIFFIGPHLGFIAAILGTYAAVFGIFLAALEVMNLLRGKENGIVNTNVYVNAEAEGTPNYLGPSARG